MHEAGELFWTAHTGREPRGQGHGGCGMTSRMSPGVCGEPAEAGVSMPLKAVAGMRVRAGAEEMRVRSLPTRGEEEAKPPGCVDHARDCWPPGYPKERCVGRVRSERDATRSTHAPRRTVAVPALRGAAEGIPCLLPSEAPSAVRPALMSCPFRKETRWMLTLWSGAVSSMGICLTCVFRAH